MAALNAAMADAQAASVVKLGPWKLKTAATRPAMMFASSPGMVSSLMIGKCARTRSIVSSTIAVFTFSGSA